MSLFNDLRIDRRLIALVIGFGLCFPYALLPYGFGQFSIKSFKVELKANHPPRDEYDMEINVNTFNGICCGSHTWIYCL